MYKQIDTAVIRYDMNFKFPAKIKVAFSQMLAIRSWSIEPQKFLNKKPNYINAKKMASKLGIQTYQILTKDDEVCIPSLSSIF